MKKLSSFETCFIQAILRQESNENTQYTQSKLQHTNDVRVKKNNLVADIQCQMWVSKVPNASYDKYRLQKPNMVCFFTAQSKLSLPLVFKMC